MAFRAYGVCWGDAQDESWKSKLNDVHANQLLVNIKNNYREKDGITIFKILIERCGSNSTNGFLKDPQLRKVLFEDIIGVFSKKLHK